MRAVVVSEFGGPEVLQLQIVPDPVPGPDELLIAVEVAGVLWVETMIRSGRGGPRFPLRPPYIPGAGAAGVVTRVGGDVDPSWIGRRVVVNVGSGGYAEQVVAAADSVLPIPDDVTAADAMALMHDGNTALALFKSAGIPSGAVVLLIPAAGGLGNLLLQLLRNAGCRTVAGVRGQGKMALVGRLGAGIVFDYGEDGWPDRVRAATGGVDVAFDGVGGEIGIAALGTVRRGGQFSAYGSASGAPTVITRDEAARRGVTSIGMEQLGGFAVGRMARVAEMLAATAAGQVEPTIGARYPLERAADAHLAIANRTTVGKVLLVNEGS